MSKEARTGRRGRSCTRAGIAYAQLWSLVLYQPVPGQHACSGHVHVGLSHPGQIVSQRLLVGRTAGASQKPTEATHMHAVFSAGQHEGHVAPGAHFGVSPALQKSRVAKQSHVWSGVAENDWPGQQPPPHSHEVVLQPGQMLEQMLEVGRDGVAAFAAAVRSRMVAPNILRLRTRVEGNGANV